MVLIWLLILGMVLFVAGSVLAFQRLEKAKRILPELPRVMTELNSRPSTIESADHKILFSIQAEYRKTVKRSEIPNRVADAIIAAEDKRFYTHEGVDFWSIARILFVAAREGTKESGGGSTLTMQIAKRVFTGDKVSIDRKLDNMAMAVMIEREWTKDEILTFYANQVFFGERAYGISAAADVYFGKTLEKLTVAEAALLSRCVRRPSDENPRVNLKKAVQNRDVVLGIMREEKMITQEEYTQAINEPVKLAASRPAAVRGEKVHPYFVDYVLNELAKKKIDISRGGYRVFTTLNTKYQKIAETGVNRWTRNLRGYAVNQMAVLVTDNNGRILSMVGGPDYDKSEFNMMWMGPGRQLGSSMKPFVYLAGLDRGVYGEGSTVSTKPIRKPGTREYVKGGANRGHISIGTALASSNNTAAARAITEIGYQNTLNLCRRSLGFRRSNLQAVQSLSLGSGEVFMPEVAEAYSVLQSHGDRYPTYAIERVVNPDGTDTNMTPTKAADVVSSWAAEYVDLCLRQVVTGGTGKAAGGVRNARGKTGTTSDHKDAWFCGYTDKIIGLVWVANEQIVDGRPKAVPLRGLYGGEGPARVWNSIMGDIQDAMGEKSRSFSGVSNSYVPEDNNDEEVPDEDPTPEPADPSTPPEQPDGEPTPEPEDPTTPAPGTSGGTTGGTSGGTTTGGSTTGGGTTGGGTTGGAGNSGGQDVVYVNVCADSGQRANSYCSETVRRPFFKGSEPRGSCPIHGGTEVVHNQRQVGNHVGHLYAFRKSGHAPASHRAFDLAFLLRSLSFSSLAITDRSR